MLYGELATVGRIVGGGRGGSSSRRSGCSGYVVMDGDANMNCGNERTDSVNDYAVFCPGLSAGL